MASFLREGQWLCGDEWGDFVLFHTVIARLYELTIEQFGHGDTHKMKERGIACNQIVA